ncbi:hypothetical protein SAMN04487891_10319 [Flagellimonas taeanensis]|uniref:Uncharacterized protein n=1 Tax=Flagellimonas taeanensis TaxID=1005926 RepID=A0A1M6T176_9FLAO|nr:hypothetical protein [Allomuricauda taeanensis]SFB84660.1 hypothetical protein SAMN04487891_10319 [Allomuricauda taeanensis]SHK50691.1 hypothetical protein SAMN05216293_1180 [Allomuricauda taeanensis]
MKRYALIGLVVLISYLSNACSSDDGRGQEIRNYRYEVTGTISVPVQIQYTPTILSPEDALDDVDYEETAMLPWTKEVSLHYLASGVGLSVAVEDGFVGETVSIKIFLEDEQVAVHTAEVAPDGVLVFTVNYYIDGTVTVHSD